MNIFAVDKDPKIAAQCLVDTHVIKMILETAQLLSTAHRVLDGKMEVRNRLVPGTLESPKYRKHKVWTLPDDRNDILYQATHINHPSNVWVRRSNNNYTWLFSHFCYLLNEYTYRYGKLHKCADPVFHDRLSRLPNNIPVFFFTPVTPAMPEEYLVVDDSVASYRNYYKNGKKHLHKWTKRELPEWLVN